MIHRLQQSRLALTFSNDLIWICLTVGFYWAFLEPPQGMYPAVGRIYGWIHYVLGVWGCLSLYLSSAKAWRVCLWLMMAEFVDDSVFYILSNESVNAIIFGGLAWGCLTRNLGLYQSGKLLIPGGSSQYE